MRNNFESYITVNEERNIKSDVSSVKKIVSSYFDKTKNLRISTYTDIGKKAISLSKAVTENEMEDFKYQVVDWIFKKYGHTITMDVEAVIDAVIEKAYQ